MYYKDKITDRAIGRNAQLFARSVADLDSEADRYPYLRILISIVEQAHPEWNTAPHKPDQIAGLLGTMSNGTLDKKEVAEVVRIRDRERDIRSGRG